MYQGLIIAAGCRLAWALLARSRRKSVPLGRARCDLLLSSPALWLQLLRLSQSKRQMGYVANLVGGRAYSLRRPSPFGFAHYLGVSAARFAANRRKNGFLPSFTIHEWREGPTNHGLDVSSMTMADNRCTDYIRIRIYVGEMPLPLPSTCSLPRRPKLNLASVISQWLAG